MLVHSYDLMLWTFCDYAISCLWISLWSDSSILSRMCWYSLHSYFSVCYYKFIIWSNELRFDIRLCSLYFVMIFEEDLTSLELVISDTWVLFGDFYCKISLLIWSFSLFHWVQDQFANLIISILQPIKRTERYKWHNLMFW